MLKIEKISKTFNPGTINEKATLQGLRPAPAPLGFRHHHRLQRQENPLLTPSAAAFSPTAAAFIWTEEISPSCRNISAPAKSAVCSRILCGGSTPHDH